MVAGKPRKPICEISGSNANMRQKDSPATAANSEDSAQAMPLMRLTLMPMSRAVVSLLEVARIAMPTRVKRNSSHSAARIFTDRLLGGGFPGASVSLVMGPSGIGKTSLGLSFRQTIYAGGALSSAYRQAVARRDASRWTVIQGVLAPVQFLAFAVSLVAAFPLALYLALFVQQAITNLHTYLERKANEVAVLQRRLEQLAQQEPLERQVQRLLARSLVALQQVPRRPLRA